MRSEGKIYHDDWMNNGLPGKSVQLIIADPPYFETKGEFDFVWNTYIENTPKTIRSGLRTLVKMWTKHTSAAEGVVEKNITSFAIKYG